MKTPRLTSLGGFRLEAKIGEGGMGVVYRAFDSDLQRVVAIKRIHPRYAGEATYAERFLAEARSVAAVIHPNIAQIFSIHGTTDGSPPFFVMEYIDGTSAEARVEAEGPCSPTDACEIVLGAARGLRAAHQQGIVHRDIKPSNVLITRRGGVKLVDFGLARQISDLGTLTEVGVVLGTPHYVSPEQGRGHRVDHRSDIYSLGCTMYYLLTGQEPFDGASKMDILLAHTNQPPPSVRHRRPDVPVWVDRILTRMLAKEPDDRYQDYEALIGDLASPFSRTSDRFEPPPPARSQRVLVSVLLILVGISISFSVVSYLRFKSGETSRELVRDFLGPVITDLNEWEALNFDFNERGAQLLRFLVPSKTLDEPDDDHRRLPFVADGLRWQNYNQHIAFPYLDEFQEIVLEGVRFRGQPDFELILGYDRLHPENVVRLFFGVRGRNTKIIECVKSGQVSDVRTEGDLVDFTLNDQDCYVFRLKRKPANKEGQIEFEFTIQLVYEDNWQQRCFVSFYLDEKDLPRGQIALRGEGISSWTIAIDSVMIAGRLDYARTARELLGREGT